MKVGDTVSLLDDDVSGTVISMVDGMVSIMTTDGFSMEVSEKELVVEDSLLEKTTVTSSVPAEKKISKKKKKRNQKTRVKQPPALEVDLHIHKLTSARHLSNFEMLNIQLDEAKRQLDFAIQKKIQRVILIHGVGEGVLKMELHTLLNRYDNLKYYEADPRKYGAGATEAYILQNSTLQETRA